MATKIIEAALRQSMGGFGLLIILLGLFFCAAELVLLFRENTAPMPRYAFEGLVLIGLGGGLRLLARIDARLEGQVAQDR